jgi:hypothetical protein
LPGHGGSGAGGSRYPPQVVVLRRIAGRGCLAEDHGEGGGAEDAADGEEAESGATSIS